MAFEWLTSVAHKTVAKVKIAKQLLASTRSSTFTLRRVTNTTRPIVRKKIRFVTRKVPQYVWMRNRARLRSLTAGKPPPLIPPSPISPRRSCPIICRQTVSRSQTTYRHGERVSRYHNAHGEGINDGHVLAGAFSGVVVPWTRRHG